jgi:hypothetical protein
VIARADVAAVVVAILTVETLRRLDAGRRIM